MYWRLILLSHWTSYKSTLSLTFLGTNKFSLSSFCTIKMRKLWVTTRCYTSNPFFLLCCEEDKNELNGLYEMGLMDLYPWADKGRARLVQRSIMDRHYEKLRWNPNINRILAQREFLKIRALMKTFFVRDLSITFRFSQRDSYKEKIWTPRKGGQSSTTIKAPIPSHAKVRIILPFSGTLELWE